MEGLFEGRRVWQHAFLDGYMKTMYGDYMTIPPVEKRGMHVFMELDTEALARSVSQCIETDHPSVDVNSGKS